MIKFKRDNVVFFLITIGFAAIVARAFYVQIIKTEFLTQEGDKRQIRTIEIPAPRGEIYDRHGSLLALSTPMASVWVDPKIITAHEADYLKFLGLMKLTDSQLSELATRNKDKRLSFIQQVSDSEVLKALSELDLPGIYTKYIDMSYSNGEHQIEVSKSLPSIWVDIATINRYRYTYARLAAVLKLANNSLAEKIRVNPKKRFMYIQRSIEPGLAKEIDSMDLVGVYTQDEYKRYYPAGESTAHLVGFTNIDDNGIEGLELAYEDWLGGTPGKKQVIKDRAGHVVDFIKDVKAASPGKPITLSIDQDIQFFAYRALKEAMIKHQAQSASLVMIDAKTGEILSMVSLPGYNPNDLAQRSGPAVRNNVIADLIEPGSTVKPFIVSKGLDAGVITAETEIDTSPGWMRIQNRRISDTKDHHVLTPLGIIQKSSNIGASKIAFKLTIDQQRELMEDVGFGANSGLFLPGETNGIIKTSNQWQPIDQASYSFGYGFNTNLLNLAHAYLLFTNKGSIPPLSVIKLDKAPASKSVIKPDAALTTLKMMEAVVAPGGTAVKAQIPGYRVAGKTGTAHKTTSQGGYAKNTYQALFVGIAPVSDPDMILAVLINEPSRGVYYGGAVAAPVFKEVMQEALRLRHIQPDQLVAK